MTEPNTFTFGGKIYEIIAQEYDHQPSSWYAEQMQFAINTNDYATVKNRIINGLKSGWIKEIK
jgi:hypothetical protein